MKTLFRRWVFAVLFLGCANAMAAQTVLVLGDSLSAAYGLPQELGWVNLLQQRLIQTKSPYRVLNASVSGETSSGGLYRIDSLLSRYRPAVLILALGANDGLRGLAPAETQDHLAQIIQRAQRAGARVVLVGMRLPPNYGPAYTEKFQQLYSDLAHSYRLPFVPFLLASIADQRDYFQGDGLHPIAEAQPLLLNTVWPAVQQALRGAK